MIADPARAANSDSRTRRWARSALSDVLLADEGQVGVTRRSLVALVLPMIAPDPGVEIDRLADELGLMPASVCN